MLLSAVAACSPKNAGPVDAARDSGATPTTQRESTGTASAPMTGHEASAAAAFDGCDTCHVDVADQVAKTKHQAKRISCVKCHGPSREHAKDENNGVKPDRVFARGDIETFCNTCHKCSRPRGGVKAAVPGKAPICTDCHGSHKIVRVGKPGKSAAASLGSGRG